MIRGELPPPRPDFSGPAAWERELFARVHEGLGLSAEDAPLLTAPPFPVEVELAGGELLDFGGGARVLSVPGHTPGGIALHLPAHGVLSTGDAIAGRLSDSQNGDGSDSGEGRAVLRVFNTDRAAAVGSLRAMAALETETACFGHGAPVREGAAGALRKAAALYS